MKEVLESLRVEIASWKSNLTSPRTNDILPEKGTDRRVCVIELGKMLARAIEEVEAPHRAIVVSGEGEGDKGMSVVTFVTVGHAYSKGGATEH